MNIRAVIANSSHFAGVSCHWRSRVTYTKCLCAFGPMLFSFEWYSKVSVTESLILKSLLFIEARILNSIPFKEMKKKCHTYVGIYIHITVIPIIENGEMLHQLLNSGGISWTFIFYTITTVVKYGVTI